MLFGVTLVIYTFIRLMPSDYVTNIAAGQQDITPEMVASLRSLYGMDDGIIEGYIKWISKAIRGDFGVSFTYQRPVAEIIGERMWTSFSLSASAFVIELLIGVSLGIFISTRQYTKTDYILSTLAFIGLSLPSFFFAAVLQRVFAVELKLLPLNGMVNARADYQGMMLFLDKAHHLVLPVMVFVVAGVGRYMRYVRTNMLEVLNADYIRTARAKGLSERAVVYRHAFRNTLIPLATMVGGVLPGLFSGAVITERIFGIQGIGYTGFDALTKGDIPFMMAFFTFLAVLTLIGTLLSDILYAVVDPRVRYS